MPYVSAGLPGLVTSVLHIPRDVPPDLIAVLRSWRRISRRPAQRSHAELLLQGCSKIAPPSTSGPVSTPTHLAMCFGPTLPRVEHVPPSWVLTTLTAFSTESFAGLLHPAADHGVHRVAVLGHALARFGTFPPMLHPPEPSPPEQPCPTSPQAIAPSPSSVATPTRPRGLAPLVSPLRP